MFRKLSMLGVLLALAAPAAAEGTRLPPVTDPATLKECSACHMVYPPQFLPARSWTAIMGDLGNHFGENAALAEPETKSIVAYLTAHAADAPKTQGGARYLKGVAADATPLRITQIPFWLRRHDEISATRFASANVKSAANCEACHKGAGKGVFAEEEGAE